jgi:putative ABC transport system permease protein
VIGVLPGGTAIGRSYHQMWRPLIFTPENRTRNYHWLLSVARLKTSTSIEQARANMNTIAGRIAAVHPDTNKGCGIAVAPFAEYVVSRELRQSLKLLMSAAAAVLLIACVNVASLFLTRGIARQREVAIRLSLGGGRARLIRQFAAEGALLCVVGTGLGLAFGYVVMRGLNVALPAHSVPAEAEIAVNVPVLLFSLALTILTTLVCAVVPAVQTTRAELAEALRKRSANASAGKAQTRLQGAFVVLQVALAFALLTTAGLLLRSIQKLKRVELGVDATNLLTARLPIDQQRFPIPDNFTAYLRQITERVAALPGVRDVSLAITLPLQRGGYGMGVQVVGDPLSDIANRPFTFLKPVAPSYFRTMRMRLLNGRALTPLDRRGSPPVAVINRAFAQKFFPNRNPISQRVLIEAVLFGQMGHGPDVAWEVVGVVSDERVGSPENRESEPIVYASMEQAPQMISQHLIVRGEVSATSLARDVRTAIHSINPDQVLTDVKTLEEIKTDSLGARRFQSGLLAAFALVALLLAALGIYGVLAHSVEQRRRELGIRSALGASARQLIGHILSRGMILVGIGLSLGIAIAFATTRLMTGFLFGVNARDPITLGAGFLLLGAVAWIACYFPARRAVKVDPIICLRCE